MYDVKLSGYDKKLSRQADLELDSNTLRGAEEIAAYARMGRNKVRALINRGEFPVKRFDGPGTVAVTTKAAVDDFLYFSSWRGLVDPEGRMSIQAVIRLLRGSVTDRFHHHGGEPPQVMMCGGVTASGDGGL